MRHGDLTIFRNAFPLHSKPPSLVGFFFKYNALKQVISVLFLLGGRQEGELFLVCFALIVFLLMCQALYRCLLFI